MTKREHLAALLREGRNLALDAGAGSGKTTALVNTVTSIFFTDDRVRPEEVLLLTFTEKAAAEMRERLYLLWQSLYAKLRTGHHRRGEEILTGYHGEIVMSEELSRSREKLMERLAHMNEYYGRLGVSTLHSFCLSLLREHTVEAGCDPDFEVIDTFETHRAFEDAFMEFLHREFEDDPIDGRWNSFFDHFGGPEPGRQFLWDFFREMCLNTRDLFFLFRDRKSMMQETDLAPYFADFQVPYFLKLREYLLSSSPREKDIALAFERLGALNDEMLSCLTSGALPDASTIESFTRVITSINGNRLRSRQDFPLNSQEFTHRVLTGATITTETIRCSLPKLRDKIAGCTGTLTRLQAGVMIGGLLMEKTDALLALFNRNKGGNMDFLDLLIRAAGLVSRSKGVRNHLKRRYRYLFIDEFQDTDPVQAYLCSFICEKEGGFARTLGEVDLEPGKLFIVGDPRQSIYRFRRADPKMHFSMIDLIAKSGGTRKSLSANYRSTPALVRFYNGFFPGVFEGGPDHSFPYGPPLEAGRSAVGPSPAVCYYTLGADGDREGFIASLLKGIKQSGIEVSGGDERRPVAWRDMTILYVGDFGKRVLAPLRETLNRAGIPLLMPSLKGFYERQEVKDLLFLLEAICDPANRTALYGALKSTIFGFTDSQLAGHFSGDTTSAPELAEALAMVDRWSALRDTVGVHELLSAVVADCGYEYSALLMPDGQRIFFNVEKLLLVAREFDQKYSSSLRDFTGFLRQQIRVAAEEGEIPYFEEGEDAVRIMSVHSAKGLEFPVVIYYLTGEFSGTVGGPILYDRVGERFGFTRHNFSTPSCYHMVEDRIEEGGGTRTERIPFLALEGRRSASEALRLSYVAMTRARDLLLVVSHPPASGKMKKNVIAEKLDAYLAPYPPAPSSCPFTATRGETRSIEEGASVFSCHIGTGRGRDGAAATRPGKRDVPEIFETKEAVDAPILSKRAEAVVREEEGFGFGNAVHRILEVAPPFYPGLFEDAIRLSRLFFKKDAERERFLGIVEKIKESPLVTRFAGWESIGTEVPIVAPKGRGIVREAADLVLAREGRLLVIDYKTGGRSPQKDAQAVDQLAGYVTAIAESTGMAVSGITWYLEEDAWIEVPPPDSSGGCVK